MNSSSPAVKRLALAGVAYLAILAPTGELHWGTGAMVLFVSLWAVQAVAEVWNANRNAAPHRS